MKILSQVPGIAPLRQLAAALLSCIPLALFAQTSLLPTPENTPAASYGTFTDATGATRDVILMNGIPIAFKYDDVWSYSAPLLNALQDDGFLPAATYGTFDFSTGVGTLDVVLATQAGGTTNQNVGSGGAFDFQDPADLANGNPVKWWACNWGGDPQTCSGNFGGSNYSTAAAGIGGTVTVGNVLDYLQSFNPLNSIPVFYSDWNQTGADDSILFNAKVELIDPNTQQVVHTWALDTVDQAGDGDFDAAGKTFNFGSLSFCSAATFVIRGAYHPITNPDGCAGVTDNDSDYLDLDHNIGSGKPDFIAFAPTMDLRFYDPDLLFVVSMYLGCPNGGITGIDDGQFTFGANSTLGCNTNGAEELFMTGQIGTPIIVQVPEPGTLALLGLGLWGLTLALRRARPRAVEARKALR